MQVADAEMRLVGAASRGGVEALERFDGGGAVMLGCLSQVLCEGFPQICIHPTA